MRYAERCYWYDKEVNDPPYCRLRKGYIDEVGGCTYCCMDKDAADLILYGLSTLLIDKVNMVAKIQNGLGEEWDPNTHVWIRKK